MLWPPGLEALSFGRRFNQRLPQLPSLRSLSFGERFNQRGWGEKKFFFFVLLLFFLGNWCLVGQLGRFFFLIILWSLLFCFESWIPKNPETSRTSSELGSSPFDKENPVLWFETWFLFLLENLFFGAAGLGLLLRTQNHSRALSQLHLPQAPGLSRSRPRYRWPPLAAPRALGLRRRLQPALRRGESLRGAAAAQGVELRSMLDAEFGGLKEVAEPQKLEVSWISCSFRLV